MWRLFTEKNKEFGMFADDLFVPHKRKLKLNKPCELKHLSSKRKKKITQDFESSGERTRKRLYGRNERAVVILLRGFRGFCLIRKRNSQ